MRQQIETYVKSLEKEVRVSKKLVLLYSATAFLGGFALGMLLAPPRSIAIGSNNQSCQEEDCGKGCCQVEEEDFQDYSCGN